MIPASTTITLRGKRLRRNLIWVAAVIVGVNLMAWALGLFFDAEGASAGPDGSSYVTTAGGSAAFAGLLERLDRSVIRSRQPLDDSTLGGVGSLVVIDVDASSYSAPELNAIDRYIRDGGTLLIGGRGEVMGRIVNDAPEWQSAGVAQATVSLDRASGVTMQLSGFGSLRAGPGDEVVAEASGTAVAIRRRLGEGAIVWLADSAPLHNATIGQGQNAVAVMAMLAEAGAVTFDEIRHGYAVNSGLWASLPRSVRTMLWLMGVVLAAGLVAYGRRFGPPHDLQRRMPPGREEYLDAIGGMMHRAGARADVLSAIRAEGLRRLAERYGSSSTPEGAARSAGLDSDQISALLGNDDDPATLVLADSALATLNTKERDESR